MTKINRFNGDVQAFASNQQSGERRVFGATDPIESDLLSDQLTPEFLRGWGSVGPSEFPPIEWFNALGFTVTQFIAYLHQVGIPEWNEEQEYHLNSMVNFNGDIYVSNSDNNIGNDPSSSEWRILINSTKTIEGLDANSLYDVGNFASIDGSISNVPNGRRGILSVKELDGRYQQIFISDNGGLYTRMTTNLIYDPWSTIHGEEIGFSSISSVKPVSGTKVTLTDKQRSDGVEAVITSESTNTGPFVDIEGEIESQVNGTVASVDRPFAASTETNREDKLNLHFGTMHGNPFRQTESGGAVNYTITGAQSAGSYQIALSSVSGLVPNQTIVYLCADNTYKTNVIDSILSNTVNLKKPLQKDILAGDNFWNFWDDRAHANPFGYYAIADDAIDELRYTGEVQETILPAQLDPLVVGDTITLLNNDDPESPGCVDVQYAQVTAAAIGGGATTKPVKLTAGMYKVTGVLNPSINSDINELFVGVRQARPKEDSLTPVVQVVANARLSVKDCLTYFEFTFYAQDRHYQTLYFESDTAGVFEVGKCEFIKVTDNINTLNSGKHVLYGDSWIDRGHIYNRLVERLPNATFVKKGNPGWASDQLFNDFDNQVAPEKPDTVWLMCSTNDYFRNYTVDKFSFEMGRIKQKIFGIGANCICWDSTVGANDDPDPTYSHNLTRSRQYALVTSYRRSNVKYDYFPVEKVRDTIAIKETIPAGQEVLVGVFASTERDVEIVYSAFENFSTVDVKIGFTSSVAVPFSNIITWAANVIKRPRDGEKVIFDGTRKIPTVSLTNTTGADITITGTIIAEYYPER
ncbi:SGNH hydrolase-type esterase domain protein [Vibrio phage 1.154.O._10N.222.52.B12]|nr:SGNH hydrolase-type esterase domain protein [Vibrio phage 1.154.O._10N.222.52.B12]